MLEIILNIILYSFSILIGIRVLMEIFILIADLIRIIRFSIARNEDSKLNQLLWISPYLIRALIPKSYIKKYKEKYPDHNIC